MKKLYMVSPTTIGKLANSMGMSSSDIEFSAACYEAGMEEVLRRIAELECNQSVVYQSEFTKAVGKDVEDAYQVLMNTLHRMERPLVDKFDEAWTSLSSAEAHDYFVEGFLKGYRYLKSEIAHRGKFYYELERKKQEIEDEVAAAEADLRGE